MTCFDEASMSLDSARYLAAKMTVDDRALNRHVLAELRRLMPVGAPQVLEVGACLGPMVARLVHWGMVGAGGYMLLELDRHLLLSSRPWMGGWLGSRRGMLDPRPHRLLGGT